MKSQQLGRSSGLRRTLLAAFATLWTATGGTWAVSAWPGFHHETQPDGTQVEVRLCGDEHRHWQEDARGFTVVRHRGWYVYAEKAPDGRLTPTELRAGIDQPEAFGLSRGVRPDRSSRPLTAPGSATGGTSEPQALASASVMKNLVVLLRFANHATRTLPTTADLDVLMNAETPHATLAPTGSVKGFYRETSYGQFEFDSTVAYWVDLPQTEAYYANGDSGLTTRTHEALKYALGVLNADPNFHFADFDQNGDGYIDAITFVHSGYGAEWGGTDESGAYYTDRIWSHKWSMSTWTSSDGVRVSSYNINPSLWGTSGGKIGRIGVICHELGHYIGLPDLYDGSGGSGIGSWCVMANSWGFDGSQYYPGHFSAWSKIQLGWVSPTVITGPGSYTLPQAATNQAVYRINLGYPSGEYLLVENRQPVGFDGKIPAGGLAVFHIDDKASYTTEGYPGQTGWPQNGNHYRVALLQADGLYELEKGTNRGNRGDLYRGGEKTELGPDTVPNTDAYQAGNILITGNRLFNVSTPGSTMTFNFEVVSNVQPPAAPTALAATATSDSTIGLVWADNSTNEDGFQVERSTDGVNFGLVATTAPNAAAYTDSGLNEQTTYWYRVYAFNTGGVSASSNAASATTETAPQQLVRYASQDLPVAGTVSGSYVNTFADDGTVETITEVESGGKPNSRYSYLDHRWNIPDVRGGLLVQLVVQAWAPANSEGDNFQFQYSTNNGVSWQYALTVPQGSASTSIWTAELAIPAPGPVIVRVIDTDSSPGNRQLNAIHVDEIHILTILDANDTPPAAPTGLAAGAGQGLVSLSWADNADNELGYRIYRAQGGTFQLVGSVGADVTVFDDTTVSPATTYEYKVSAFTTSWETASDTTVIVQTPDGIALAATSAKVKAKIVVNLSWTTGASITAVDVLRSVDGGAFVPLATGLANDHGGGYTDNTGLRGGTLRYRVVGGGYQSNEVEVAY